MNDWTEDACDGELRSILEFALKRARVARGTQAFVLADYLMRCLRAFKQLKQDEMFEFDRYLQDENWMPRMVRARNCKWNQSCLGTDLEGGRIEFAREMFMATFDAGEMLARVPEGERMIVREPAICFAGFDGSRRWIYKQAKNDGARWMSGDDLPEGEWKAQWYRFPAP